MDISKLSQDINSEVISRLSHLPSLEAIVPVGSLADASARPRSSRLADLDYLVLVQPISADTLIFIEDQLTDVCDNYTDTSISVEYCLINGAFKPPPRADTSLLIHVLLHELSEFLQNQPSLFLYSWSAHPPQAGSFDHRSLCHSAPSFHEFVTQDYGLRASRAFLKRFPEFEFPQWRLDATTHVPRLDTCTRTLGSQQQVDLLLYFLWAACNALRCSDKERYSIQESTFATFRDTLGSNLDPMNGTLPLELFRLRADGASLDATEVGDLLQRASAYLGDLESFVRTGASLSSFNDLLSATARQGGEITRR